MSIGLPTELVFEILSFAVADHAKPSCLLCVDSVFYCICQRLIQRNLVFRKPSQLKQFAEGKEPLICTPKTLTLELGGGTDDIQVFKYLKMALERCMDVGQSKNNMPVALDALNLRLHSHARDPNLGLIFEALSLANPKSFSWTGPDPEHHFSTAIVPAATIHVFRAISTWSNIQHIKLTNISFPSLGFLGPQFPKANTALFPPLRSLRTLYLGQATFLPPSSIAALVALSGMDSLEKVRLVDAYSESIWGLRVRKSDVEQAIPYLPFEDHSDLHAVAERLQSLISCEMKTERLAGGDRFEETDFLE